MVSWLALMVALLTSALAHAAATVVCGREQVQCCESPSPGLYERLGESISHTYLQIQAAEFA